MALATTSAGFAFSQGLPDSDAAVSRDRSLAHIAEITAAVDLPVNADFSSGYGKTPSDVTDSVTRCVATGVAGLSIEDATGEPATPLYELPLAVERVRAAREAIDRSGSAVLLTARAECYHVGHPDALRESVRRLQAYAQAGADVLFAPGPQKPEDIKTLVEAVHPRPFNLLVVRNIGLDVGDIAALGVRRISVGGALALTGWTAFMRSADLEGERQLRGSCRLGTLRGDQRVPRDGSPCASGARDLIVDRRPRRLIMKIVVIGGTGLIGSKLVTLLREHSHDVVAASPNSGVNTITGEGLAEALRGATVVVDVSNSPSFEDEAVMTFFETSTRNLLAAEAEAGVRHHVALSVVGTDRLSESGYFRAKIAQEQLIRGSAIPHSIVHATQFFEFVKSIAAAATDGNRVRLAPVLIQPMAADDVASAVCGIAEGKPVNGTVEVAGPERLRLDELVRMGLGAQDDPREVVTDPRARYFGAELAERTLLPNDDARLGETRFEDWLRRPVPQK